MTPLMLALLATAAQGAAGFTLVAGGTIPGLKRHQAFPVLAAIALYMLGGYLYRRANFQGWFGFGPVHELYVGGAALLVGAVAGVWWVRRSLADAPA